jgi:predicted small metal-binding protein
LGSQGSSFNPSRSQQASSEPSGFKPSREQKRFRCADLGHPECNWEATGREEELYPKIEQHGREKHNIRSFDQNTREQVRNAMRDVA